MFPVFPDPKDFILQVGLLESDRAVTQVAEISLRMPSENLLKGDVPRIYYDASWLKSDVAHSFNSSH